MRCNRLPISTLIIGVIWSWLPKRCLGYDISGWQARSDAINDRYHGIDVLF
ncbi:hypothetical protein ACT691_01285 [Vibrio metschnikovii]